MWLILVQKLFESSKTILYVAKSRDKELLSNRFFKVVEKGIGFLVATIMFLLFAGDHIGEHAWRLVVLVAVISYCADIVGREKKKLYKGESLSVLLPFEKLHLLLTIVAGYLLFLDTSIRAVLIAVFAIVFLFWAETNIHRRELSKDLHKILWVQGLNTVMKLMLGFVLLHIDKIEYYLYFTFFLTIPPLIQRLKKPSLDIHLATTQQRSRLPIVYTIVKYINSFAFVLVVADFGLDIAVVFSLGGVIVTMLMGWFFLGEKFGWKDIVISLVLFGLMSAGVYWR